MSAADTSLFHTVMRDLPQVYRLGYANGTIVLHIHPKAYAWMIDHLSRHSGTVLYDKNTADEIGLKKFSFPGAELPGLETGRWGYGDSVKHRRDYETDWDVLDCPVPSALNPDGDLDYTALHQLQATLNVILHCLSRFEEPITSSETQLVHVPYLLVENKLYGGALSAYLSPKFCVTLAKAANGRPVSFPVVEQAMYEIHRQMEPKYDVEPHEFSCFIRNPPKQLILTVPGNACDLAPVDPGDDDLEVGSELMPHNTDQPLQQITLLVGLAKLYEFARKDLNEP